MSAASPLGKVIDNIDPEPKSLAKFHLIMMFVWGLLAVPTVLLWKESILWVAFMSLYANFVGHFSGWDAARAEEKADDDSSR
jgi:hypothetical protein